MREEDPKRYKYLREKREAAKLRRAKAEANQE